MRGHFLVVVVSIVLGGLAGPATGDQVKYYAWTDDNGVRHFEDTPPKDRDYETRVIEVDTNVMPSPGIPAATGGAPGGSPEPEPSSPAATETPGPPDAVDRAIAEDEQKRLQEGDGTGGGAETAPGADTAPSSSGAPSSGAASGASTAGGAATAPGAALPPVFGP